MILADARNAFVRHAENPRNRCPYEAGMGNNKRATGFGKGRQLIQLFDCPCVQLEEGLASRRPVMGEEFGPRPRVFRVLKLDFFPSQSLPPAEVHLPKAGGGLVVQPEMPRNR